MSTSSNFADALTTSHILKLSFPALGETSHLLGSEGHPAHTILQGGEPRWIILGDPHEALPVLRSWRPWNLKSRLQWSAVLTATSIKMLHRLPGVHNERVYIDPCYWKQSLPKFPASWNAVIHVGSRSYTRKASVFFLGSDRLVGAVAKVPLAPAAALAILNEAAILHLMKAEDYLPNVLFQDLERGATAQSWLDGKPVSSGFTAAHLDLLSLLVNPGRTTRVSDYRPAIDVQLDELDLPFERSLLSQALELLDFDEPLQGFVEHRDFAPWNLKWLPNGSLGLLDWEWAVSNSLPWQDVCRFFYLDDVHFDGPGRVWEAMNSNPLLKIYRQRFVIPPAALMALTMHYLLRVLCMDWQSGNVGLAQYTFRQIRSLLDTSKQQALNHRKSTPNWH
jgi:hypothetical protein